LVAHFSFFSDSFSGFGLDSRPSVKKPASEGRRRALESLDLSGRLHQAMAVRRHGSSMMMVITVMAVALHLIETLRENPMACQMFRLRPAQGKSGEWSSAGEDAIHGFCDDYAGCLPDGEGTVPGSGLPRRA
jgi:hypothetical protein